MTYEEIIFCGDGQDPSEFGRFRDTNLREAIKSIRAAYPNLNGAILVLFRGRYKFIGYLGDIVA